MKATQAAKFLTNFDVADLPLYQEAIRRFGGSVRRTRLTIGLPFFSGKPEQFDGMRSLWLSGKTNEDLSRFWSILDKIRTEAPVRRVRRA